MSSKVAIAQPKLPPSDKPDGAAVRADRLIETAAIAAHLRAILARIPHRLASASKLPETKKRPRTAKSPVECGSKRG